MKTIHKKISLEQFKSRMPSVIPAYDKNGDIHNFNHFVDVLNEPIVNYNMIPFDVQIEEDEKYGQYSGKLYSYKELVKIFHTLDSFYNKPLTQECVMNPTISNEDKELYKWLLKNCFPFFIFDVELEGEKVNIKDIKGYWGTNRLSIQEVITWVSKMQYLKNNQTKCCDNLEYEKRGGNIVAEKLLTWYNDVVEKVVCRYEDYGHNFIYAVNDEDTSVTVKVVKISELNVISVTTHDFQIFEPRVKIIGNNRYIKYGKIDKDGNVINPQNIEIIDGILTIPCLFLSNESVLIVSEPYFVLPLALTNTMENIGEMKSIIEEWDSGYGYNTNIKNQDLLDYSGGVMVSYNGDNWILKTYDQPGFIYSETYKEIYFANEDGMTDIELEYYNDFNNQLKEGYDNTSQWERCMDYFPKIENLILPKYAYKDSQLVLNPNLYNMGEKIYIDTNSNLGFSLYKGNIYDNYNCDVVYSDFDKKYYEVQYEMIYQEDNTVIKHHPYIIINNMMIFINKSTCESYNKNFPYEISNGTFIRYGLDTLIPSLSLEQFDGVITYNGEKILFKKIQYEETIIFSALTNSIGEYKTIEEMSKYDSYVPCYVTLQEDNEWYVVIANSFNVYNSDYISGQTTSKLSEFLSNCKMAVDNLGNKLNGLMPYKYIRTINTTKLYDYVVNPRTNDWLSIPYIPKTINDIDEIENHIYWGNIIDKVIIEYEINDQILGKDEDKFYSAHKIKNVGIKTTYRENYKTTLFKNITSATTDEKQYDISVYFRHECTTDEGLKKIEEVLQKNHPKMINVKCYVEYYMGTIIEKINEKYYLKYKNNGDYYGVKYIDTLTLNKEQCLYYYDEIDTCIINYWKITPTVNEYCNQTYKVPNLIEEIAYFEYKTQPFELQYGYKLYNDDFSPTFYKVLERATTVEYKGKEYEIEIFGSKKYFSILLNKTNDKVLYEEYRYYCVVNNKRIYAEYVNENVPYFILKINEDIIYRSNGLENLWLDDEKVEISLDIYCQIPLKLFLLTPQNTADIYFDSMNDTSYSPLIIDENKLGVAIQEKIQSTNIYIDRGTVRAMDYHLRLLEAKSLESLEQIGNGFFKFNSNNEIK